MRNLRWTKLGIDSYVQEQEYILEKWNLGEVKKFIELAEKSLKQIQTDIYEGTIVNSKLRKTVISQQTTLYFRILDNPATVELLLFWNNQKDPNSLKRILRKFKL